PVNTKTLSSPESAIGRYPPQSPAPCRGQARSPQASWYTRAIGHQRLFKQLKLHGRPNPRIKPFHQRFTRATISSNHRKHLFIGPMAYSSTLGYLHSWKEYHESSFSEPHSLPHVYHPHSIGAATTTRYAY